MEIVFLERKSENTDKYLDIGILIIQSLYPLSTVLSKFTNLFSLNKYRKHANRDLLYEKILILSS